jgi:hypothetical protein
MNELNGHTNTVLLKIILGVQVLILVLIGLICFGTWNVYSQYRDELMRYHENTMSHEKEMDEYNRAVNGYRKEKDEYNRAMDAYRSAHEDWKQSHSTTANQKPDAQ